MSSLKAISFQGQTVVVDEDDLRAQLCRLSFEEFCKEFWETVPGAGSLIWGWHMSVICQELQIVAERVFRGEPAEYDLVLNQPPGTSKSTIASILFHPWTWTRMPSCRHINASHTESLVHDLANKAREVIRSEKYQRYFPNIELGTAQDAKGYYMNTLGGSRYAATVGGKSPVGFHGHLLLGDDLLNPQNVLSDADRETAKNFITNDLPTRMTDKLVSVVINIQQRLGRGDSTEVMVEVGKREGARPVRVVCLPAELTDEVQPSELRGRYVDGLLDPIRLPRVVLLAYQARDAFRYAAQFLQNPLALGGGMFKMEYFVLRERAAPYACRRIRYYDKGATQGGGCPTAGVLMAIDQNRRLYVEHCLHGQWEPFTRNQKMLAIARRDRAKYGPNYEPEIWVEREGGAGGRDSWQAIVRVLMGFRVFEDNIAGQGPKDVRAEPWSSQCAAMNVVLCGEDWDVEGFIQEHCLFKPEPGKRLGRYKDRVDAAGRACALLSKSPTIPVLRTFSIANKKKKSGVRIIVCSRQELPHVLVEDHPAILVYFADPEEEFVPYAQHGLLKLMDQTVLHFADLKPQDYQTCWDLPLPSYNKLPAEVMMDRGQGKKLWSFLIRKRGASPEVIVLCDTGNGDSRAYSTALGICDILRLEKTDTIFLPGTETLATEAEPGNPHVYSMVKATRYEVVG